MAEAIANEWLKRSKPKYTLKWSQNIQRVTDLEKGMKETDTSYLYLKAILSENINITHN